MILEGVFDAFPRLKVVLIERGFAWAPQLAWRLDAHWTKMRSKVPDLKRRPSEYMKSNLRFATQPVEEPEHPNDLRQVFDWVGWDRLVYSSDYPHWDFDDPHLAFKFQMTESEKRMLFRDNALMFIRLGKFGLCFLLGRTHYSCLCFKVCWQIASK